MTTFTTDDRIKAYQTDIEPIPFAGLVNLNDYADPYSQYHMTREEIGKELGISRQAVANIEKSALTKIKPAFFRLAIKKEDFL